MQATSLRQQSSSRNQLGKAFTVTHGIASVLLLLVQAAVGSYGAFTHLPVWHKKSIILGRIMTIAYAIPALWAICAAAFMTSTDRSESSLSPLVSSGLYVCLLWAIILFCTVITTRRELISGATYVIFATAGNTCLMAGIAHRGIIGGIFILLGYALIGISMAFIIPMLAGAWLDRLIASKTKRGRKSASSLTKK